ncbi:hypothetical protein BDR22DRAFT_885410 [Usnea florida]
MHDFQSLAQMVCIESTSRGMVVPPNSPASGDRYHSSTSSKSSIQGDLDPGSLKTMLRGGPMKDDDLTSTYEVRAKMKHDQLIAMGGRPTRPVLLQPPWNVIDRHGKIYFHDHQGRIRRTLSDDGDPMDGHWQSEVAYFKNEIGYWRDFRHFQRRTQHLDRLGSTGLQLDHANAEFVKLLKRLSDWEEFEVFWADKNLNAVIFEDKFRCYFSNEMKSEALGEDSPPTSEAHEIIRNELFDFNQSQTAVRFTKSWMTWIQGEWPKLVAESFDAISKKPDLHPVLEARFRDQTYATLNAIQVLGGQPSHAVSPPDESMDVVHRILHWSSETAIYRKELSDWKKFLQWRRRKLGDETTMDRQRHQCPQFRSAVEYFGEFEGYRRFQYNHALSWLKCMQRIVRWYEEEIDNPNPDYEHYTPQNLRARAQAARARITESKQILADAAMQLEKSAQDHASALSKQTQIGSQQGAIPPTPPPSISEGSRTSRSSSSSCSKASLSSRSPRSSQSSLSSRSSQSSRSSRSATPPSEDRNPRMQICTSHIAERRLKKINTRRLRANTANLDANTEQQAAPKIPPGPQKIIVDDDIEMADTSEDPGAVDGAENEETNMIDPGAVGRPEIEDTDMTDRHDALDYNTSFSSGSLSGPSTKIEAKKSAVSSGNGVTTRKTRSVSRPDRTAFGRIPKDVGKKPTKKAKTFTEQQATILLDAASSKCSALESPPLRRSDRLKESLASNGNDMGKKPTKKAKTFAEHQDTTHINAASSSLVPLESLPLRRSDRLKEKASASAITPPSHPNPSSSSQPPEQMQTKPKSVTIKSSRLSRHKKPKIEPDALEPLQDSTQKNSKKRADTIEQARSRRQKKVKKRALSAVSPG